MFPLRAQSNRSKIREHYIYDLERNISIQGLQSMQGMQSSKQIFISHSRKDHELMEVFRSFFNGTDVKPIFMEYESWSRKNEANWQWILRHIKTSNAVWHACIQKLQKFVAKNAGLFSAIMELLPISRVLAVRQRSTI